MKKTSLYLPADVDRELGRLARDAGITKAELIRRSLERVVEGAPRPQVNAIGVAEGAVPPDLAERADEYLAGVLADRGRGA
jgi:hypothetical protein